MTNRRKPMKAGAKGSKSAFLNLSILVLGTLVATLVASGIYKGCAEPVDPKRAATTTDLIGEYIQVEVLNGCGESGLASGMTDYLRSRGFDVVKSGNYDGFGVESSIVISRIDDIGPAKQVVRAIGLSESAIASDPDPGLFLEASVLIGCDFETIAPFSLDPSK